MAEPPIPKARSREQIIANTREMLGMAQAGYADATSADPRRRRPGIMNLFTYGRSVTMAMQTMKSLDADFAEWWRPYQEKMASGPLMCYFNTARTDVLHEGSLTVTTSTYIAHLDSSMINELNRHAPPGTVGTFFGEGATGGNGWEVRMPDGSTQKVYFSLPDSFGVQSTLHLPDPPDQHDDQPITDTSVANLGRLYLTTLGRYVEEFEARFKET